jgi:hypothetical protein
MKSRAGSDYRGLGRGRRPEYENILWAWLSHGFFLPWPWAWSKGVKYDPLIHGLGRGANPEPLNIIWGRSSRWKNGWLKRKSRRVCRRVSTYMRPFQRIGEGEEREEKKTHKKTWVHSKTYVWSWCEWCTFLSPPAVWFRYPV